MRGALDALVEHGVVTRWDGGTETVYAVGADQHLAAAYYRNTIVHFFTTGAIAEIALLGVRGHRRRRPRRSGTRWPVCATCSSSSSSLRTRTSSATRSPPRSATTVPTGPTCSRQGRWTASCGRFRPYAAHWVLRPILEAYQVTADALVAHDFRTEVDTKTLVSRDLALGEQYRAQRRIASPEAVSTVLFETAIRLAANRGLLEPGGIDVLQSRESFATEIAQLVERVGEIEELARD